MYRKDEINFALNFTNCITLYMYFMWMFLFSSAFILFFLVMSLKLSFAPVTHMRWLCVHVIIITEKTAN